MNGEYESFRPGCLAPEKCRKYIHCDMHTDGGGWTIIQQRKDSTVNFFRDWISYRNGFGNSKNFWAGNEYLYEVTNMANQPYQLMIEIVDIHGQLKFAIYDDFFVADERDNYALKLGRMVGGTEQYVDNLLWNRFAPFGTYDHDTDRNDKVTCGQRRESGWWHDIRCSKNSVNLNVPYKTQLLNGVQWKTLIDGRPVKIRSTQMKIRPTNFPDKKQKQRYESENNNTEIQARHFWPRVLKVNLHSIQALKTDIHQSEVFSQEVRKSKSEIHR